MAATEINQDGAEAPEVAPQNFPEVNNSSYDIQQQQHGSPPADYQQVYQQSYQQPYAQSFVPVDNSPQTAKTDLSAAVYGGQAAGSYRGQVVASPYDQPAVVGEASKRGEGAATAAGASSVFCGCGLLVFVLSCIIAILSAAVIGLAAGTGVEANRADDATDKLARLSSSLAASGFVTTSTVTTTVTSTSVAAAAATTAFNTIDDGCSDNPIGTNGTVYTSFSLLGSAKFTIYCNMDTELAPVLSIFTADMDTCMDACSAWSKYSPGFFGQDDNTTCAAISFIPLWTNKANATTGAAPGNCYLKPAPQSLSKFTTPNIGTEVHAALLVTS